MRAKPDYSFYAAGPSEPFTFAPDLQPIVEQLGGLVIADGWLESELKALLRKMLGLGEEKGNALVGHLDAKGCVSILRTYGLVAAPNDAWYAELAVCLNGIDRIFVSRATA